MTSISFSIDLHDKDGDKFDECLLLHINETFIWKLANIEELRQVIIDLQSIEKEISTNYN